MGKMLTCLANQSPVRFWIIVVLRQWPGTAGGAGGSSARAVCSGHLEKRRNPRLMVSCTKVLFLLHCCMMICIMPFAKRPALSLKGNSDVLRFLSPVPGIYESQWWDFRIPRRSKTLFFFFFPRFSLPLKGSVGKSACVEVFYIYTDPPQHLNRWRATLMCRKKEKWESVRISATLKRSELRRLDEHFQKGRSRGLFSVSTGIYWGKTTAGTKVMFCNDSVKSFSCM